MIKRKTQQEKFNDALEKSGEAVELVADWLEKSGYAVKRADDLNYVRQSPAEPWEDQGDLMVGMRVEVKQTSYEFTNSDDWPFIDWIITPSAAHDATRPKPYAYITVNPAGTVAGIVKPADSFSRWHRKDVKNPITGKFESRYACDPADVIFVRLI